MDNSSLVRQAEQIIAESLRRSSERSLDHLAAWADAFDRIVVGDTAAYREIVNRKLWQLARDHNIALDHDTPLFQLAVQGAVRAGFRGDEAEDAALTVIGEIVTRGSAGGSDEWTQDYARNTLLANLTQVLKTRGLSLEAVKKDRRVVELLKRYRIRPSTVETYYHEQRANKILKNVEKIIAGEKHRAPVFEAFLKGHDGTFEGFWKKVCEDQARDLMRAMNREKDVVTHAFRFDPTDEGSLDEERSVELSHDPRAEYEARAMARRLKEELEKASPRFEKALRLMREHSLDLTDPAHASQFQRELHLKPSDFREFQHNFLRELRKTFQRLNITTIDEAESILKVAKRKRSPKLARQLNELKAALSA